MNSLLLLLLEMSSLVFFSGLLILVSGTRRAPEGFQHYPLFFYGNPPEGFIPVESHEFAPATPSGWR